MLFTGATEIRVMMIMMTTRLVKRTKLMLLQTSGGLDRQAPRQTERQTDRRTDRRTDMA